MAIFLVWHESGSEIDVELLHVLDHFPLKPGLMLVDTELTRSKLYHQVKWALPKDTALLAAPLEDAPKFKGMESGALNWVRARTD
ncbi:hypothetical protein HFP57_05555 [Parasphingopyxis algicola]|uniref:hypothetical protein n=1 Tax=Parasphingopyxis algicola TaxID=2026624 RepID=UPI0015A0B567|nr:hypothetical protein [Parasphingopyxis algicola]QLC24542.1 hypothetical protein HFP57_05555 [Parasphingopyxis algicola]